MGGALPIVVSIPRAADFADEVGHADYYEEDEHYRDAAKENGTQYFTY